MFNKIRYLIMFLVCTVIVSLGVETKAYNYPLSNKYAATIIGTPKGEMAKAVTKVKETRYELEVFPNRQVPDIFWYNQKMTYSLAYQKGEAPLIFVIAGTGAGYNSSKMKILQSALYSAGFHVVSLSSPTHPNFIVSASTSRVPGNLSADAKDLYRVMGLIKEQIANKVQVSGYHLTGYSLGGAQAAFIAKLDEEKAMFNFKRVLMINPPVSLYNSVSILDEMLKNIPGGVDNIDPFFNTAMDRFTEYYRTAEFIDFNDDFLYRMYQDGQPTDDKLQALIGLSFRLSSANMIFVADVMSNSGFVTPKNKIFSTTESLTDYFKVANRVSFVDYFNNLYFPHFQEKDASLTKAKSIDNSSLATIGSYLSSASKISVVTNSDDFILAPGEVDYLKSIFGNRAKIYPKGGHCGNIGYKENIAYMLGYFSK